MATKKTEKPKATSPKTKAVVVTGEEMTVILRAIQFGSATDHRGNSAKRVDGGVYASLNRAETDGHDHFSVAVPEAFSLQLLEG
jgi:hypothetical protein